MKNLLIIVFSLLFVSTAFSKKHKLGLNLEKGKEYFQVMESKMNIVQDLQGQKMSIAIELDGKLSFTVKEIKNDNYIMVAKYVKLAVKMQMPQGTMEYSSEKNDKTDIFSTILGAFKGQSFEITMSKTGAVLNVANMEKIWDSIIAKFPNIPEQAKAQIKTQIMSSYGDKSLKGNIEMSSKIYPEKPVKKGDKWNIKSKITSNMEMAIDTEYSLTDVEKDYYVINGKSKLKTNSDKFVKTNGIELKYKLNGEMTSEIKVDKKTGWIIEARISQNLKGNNEVKANAQMPNGMIIPMELLSDMVITNN